ncbi:peptide ABC transporter ATP-binding protein [Metarhizobium album]|uniref:Peptide ABC transporter ATP-binding protein n=1 Tax=Metarhizobium album TaxID=2182425 RepID=A0A2U2DGP6_9HYPH|nr:ABC transporter ATP-binding protein [Rhizobium album]PWE52493.1 peptide ABC transporter ATP-binding protein [Rhizobium album]
MQTTASFEQETVLECCNLRTYIHTRRGLVRAVDGVDLKLKAGRALGLVGESGSGKSLTAFSIMGLIDEPVRIEEGSVIRLEGRDIGNLSRKQLAGLRGSRIAMVFQEPMTALNPVHTVGWQVGEPLILHLGMTKAQAKKRAIELLDLVGIKDAARRADDYPHQLSGGMRQRVMIAIALACDPAVLLADEPTTALDVTVQSQILTILAELRKRLRVAILLITHDLGVVEETCDDVAVMYAGRIVERGPVPEVLQRPRHPYTRALLASMPTLDTEATLRPIPGSVPDARSWPKGCRFASRCEFVTGRCLDEYPPTFAGDAGAEVACWLYDEAQPRSQGGLQR